MTQHVDNHCKGAKYPIKIEKNSLLYEIVGEETISSHCNHHQIANIIGKDLIVNCKDDNGMIHGIESTAEGRWIVTVQWHPERCEDQFNDRIFKGFLEKCKAYKKKKVFF